MRGKIINLLLILTSLTGYMEWGGNNHTFLFKAEADVFSKLLTQPGSALHPFVVLPMTGQLLLLITLFLKKPARLITYISIAAMGLLLGFIFLIGAFSLNFKILASAIPFFVVAVIALRHYRKPILQPIE